MAEVMLGRPQLGNKMHGSAYLALLLMLRRHLGNKERVMWELQPAAEPTSSPDKEDTALDDTSTTTESLQPPSPALEFLSPRHWVTVYLPCLLDPQKLSEQQNSLLFLAPMFVVPLTRT